MWEKEGLCEYLALRRNTRWKVRGARQTVCNTTNLGAIFRSAAGLGVDAVLVSPESADPLYRCSIRVSMGTVFAVPWARIGEADGRGRSPWPAELDRLRREGFTVAALELSEEAVPLDAPALRARPPGPRDGRRGTGGDPGDSSGL